jgi:uncharacterized protein YdaU (DUF1376 family)
MKFFSFHIGDWLPATMDMSPLEEGVYCRLLVWYYSHEQPLPLAFKDLNRIVRCRTRADREAVQTVVHRFFVVTDDGWRHDKAEAVLKTYSMGDSMRIARREANAARQRVSRQRRDAKLAAVISMGIEVPLSTSQSQLDAILCDQGVTQVVTRDVTCDINRECASDPVCAPAINQEPIKGAPDGTPPARARERVREAGGVIVIEPTDPARRHAAVAALKKGGFPMADANTSDPRFLALLQAGVTDDQLRLVASEAVARAKPWGWLLAVVQGRMNDAAAGYGPGRAANGRFSPDHDRVAGLTPTIAKKPPIAH